MVLSRDERAAFLAEPHIAALSVVAEAGRGPLTVPLWYGYRPHGQAWILTPAASRKAALIAAAGRFTLMVQRLEPSVRYVSVEGPVVNTTTGTEANVREMAERYLPPDAAAAYVAMSLAQHGPQVIIEIRPEHWLSADLGRAS
ncbi:MAG TPA: pyridoxamine 5'-phosphate oxidase family protein [Pseudonocardia sp.]